MTDPLNLKSQLGSGKIDLVTPDASKFDPLSKPKIFAFLLAFISSNSFSIRSKRSFESDEEKKKIFKKRKRY